MNIKHISFIFLFMLASCADKPPVPISTNLFLDMKPSPSLNSPEKSFKWIKEERIAKLNDEYFFDVAYEPGSNKNISFNLFDDVVLNVKASSYAPAGTGTIIWHGVDAQKNASILSLAIVGRAIEGTIQTDKEIISIEALNDGWHKIIRYQPDNFMPESDPIEVKTGLKPVMPKSFAICDRVGLPTPGPGKGTRINILIAYTEEVANNNSNILAKIDLLIDQLRQVWETRNFVVYPILTDVVQVNYTESKKFHIEIDRLQNTSDGYMDNLHNLRNQSKADLVALLVNDGDFCGIGYRPNPPTEDTSHYGFTVTSLSCALNQLTLAHEIGHNLGMQHDRYVISTQPYNTYDYGYSNLNIRKRTVMAYLNECIDKKIFCQRVPSYSHPFMYVKNEHIGVEVGKANAAHNQNVLCKNSGVISQYR